MIMQGQLERSRLVRILLGGETRLGGRHRGQSVGDDDGDGNCRMVFLEMVPGDEVRSPFTLGPTSHIRVCILSLKTEGVTNIISCID